jgi:hypothetical protein
MRKVVADVSEHDDREAPGGISRRTVATAMAWAVPVIAVAAPVPAFAASVPLLTSIGAACKLPGNSQNLYKGYALGFAASNPYDVPIIITIDSLILNGTSLGNLQIINLVGCIKLGGNTISLAPNSSYSRLVVLTKDAVSSQAGTLTGTYTVTGGPGGSVTVTRTVGAVPPIQSGSCNGFTDDEKECIALQNRVTEE